MIFNQNFTQVERCLKNFFTKLSFIKRGDNLVLQSKIFDSKVKIFHEVILF